MIETRKPEYQVEFRPELRNLVTFKQNKKLPIYNWFEFKEGFSRDFVKLMLNEFRIYEGHKIIDPFCGVGTTLLVAKENGINALGIDSHPVFEFVSRVKVRDYDVEELKKSLRKILSRKFVRPCIAEVPQILKKAFSRYALEDILFLKSEIGCLDDPIQRDFFEFVLLVSAMKVSYTVKDGAVVRFFEKPHPPLRKIFKLTAKKFIQHLKKAKFKPCTIEVKRADARNLSFLAESSFDAMITSPPYLNKSEYVTAFSVEEALLPYHERIDPKKAYFGLNLERLINVFPDIELPVIAKAYFSDMQDFLREAFRILRPSGKVALVISQGIVEGMIIEADVLTARLAEYTGFHVMKRLIVNKRVATIKRTIKIGEMLESVLLMEKPQ